MAPKYIPAIPTCPLGGLRQAPGLGLLAIWVEPNTGKVRALDPCPDLPGPVAALQSLILAMGEPVPGATSSRPARVACDDPRLVAALKEPLALLGIDARTSADGWILDNICEGLAEHLAGPEPGTMFSYLSDKVDSRQVGLLFEAARRLWKLAPWKKLHVLELSGLEPTPIYASVLGSGGV